jgi:predicted phage terminase large subunit-like protein
MIATLPKISMPRVSTGRFAFGAQRTDKATLQPFDAFLRRISPDWQWDAPHLAHIRTRLEQVTRGDTMRLMLFLPPRHGKSEMTTVRYAAWQLYRNPAQRVIIGSYNQTLANKFSRKIRKIGEQIGLPIDRARTAVDDWETTQGGGVRAAGVGAGVTGMGGDLIIIDDPIKNREEANSITYRERVWTWYTDDLYTRLEPGGKIVVILTRWHEDDLAGRILNSEDGGNWQIVGLPAIARTEDAIGRKEGEALWPDRYPLSELNKIKTAVGSRAFAALYQQTPIEQEGGMFKRSHFKFMDASDVPPLSRHVRYWDTGATAGGGDPTSGVKMGATADNRFYILDVRRGQWSTNERDGIMLQTAQQDGVTVPIWAEIEPGSAGKDRGSYHARMFAGYTFRGDRPTGNKQVRAEPFAAQVEAGNVYIVRAVWNNNYIDELCMFPNGAHDDQVDASSGAFAKIARTDMKASSHRG